MISLQNILTVARYERRILARGWFFRIFAIITLLAVAVWNTAILNSGDFMWSFKSIPSGVVYNTMSIINIAQSIIAIFLASDFMKRDKKLDTAEVLFIRPMSNSDYVLGKTWGIVSLFLYLNLIGLGIVAIFTVASSALQFTLEPYAFYLLAMNIPSLIFMLGFAFFLMSLIKNQAITFLLLLAAIMAILFGVGDKFYYFFDFLGVKLPMLQSHEIGINNVSEVIYQRGIYLFVGIGLILLSITTLQRLTQSKFTKVVSSVVAVLCFVIAGASGYMYLNNIFTSIDDRAEMREISHQYFAKDVPHIRMCNIDYHQGANNTVSAELSIRNTNENPLDTYIFSLNSGYTIESVVDKDGTTLPFDRNHHLVVVHPTKPLAVQENQKLTFTYSGNIKENNSFLDAEKEDFFYGTPTMLLNAQKVYGYDQEAFTLLTIENLWYPIAGVRYDPKQPSVFNQQFTKFKLKVHTTSGLIPISQGKKDSIDVDTYKFSPRDPIPQLSLTIGNYESHTVQVEGININLVHFAGHDKYKDVLPEISDTLSNVIYDYIEEYERPIGIFYPYQNFSLVETPVHYASLQHSWTSAMAQSQPEMVLFPEYAYGVSNADFASRMERQQKRESRDNSGMTEKELQVEVFKQFLDRTFSSSEGEIDFSDLEAGIPTNPYSIFPNYYNYVNHISSDVCPVINYAFESYLLKAEEDMRNNFLSRISGVSQDERSNILLDGKSLHQIIHENENSSATNSAIQVKGEFLLEWIQCQIGVEADFDGFLLDYLYNNSYRSIKFEELASTMKERFDVDINDFINEWYTSKEIPAYLMSDMKLTEGMTDDEVLYGADIKITNNSNASGMLKFSFRSGGGRGRGPSSMEADERYVMLDAHQTKDVHFILSDQPRGVSINTLISKNLPSTSNIFGGRAEKVENFNPEEYQRVVDQKVTLYTDHEIVVDNTDSGFKTIDPSANSFIKNLVKKEVTTRADEFVSMGFGSSPAYWTLTSNSDYFGTYEHSAEFIKPGTGDKKASWETIIREEGYYEVYTHLVKTRQRGRGPGGGNRDSNQNNGSYNYQIKHSDGVEAVAISLNEIETGWNLIGSYYLLADTARIQLSNQTDANYAVADAVKWVKSE